MKELNININKLLIMATVGVSAMVVPTAAFVYGAHINGPESVQIRDFTGDGLDDILITSNGGKKDLFVGVSDNGFVHYVPFEQDLEFRAKQANSQVKDYERKVRQAIDPSYKEGERK